jgi:hypothetical protein
MVVEEVVIAVVIAVLESETHPIFADVNVGVVV